MASNSTIPPEAILNPYTPLAFLPPDIANQYQVMAYVYVATLAAYTWDWLMAMPEEYKVFRKVGFSPPNITYFVSRFGSLGCTVSTAIFIIAPIGNCPSLKYVQGVFFEIGGPATSLLFLFRVKAVYNHSRIVTAFFGFLWLSIAGLSILLMVGINGSRIPYTRRCSQGVSNTTYTTIPLILTAVFDTLVFLAISYHMVSVPMVNHTWRGRAKSFFRGDGLHHLSKALLQSGQAYYFATIGVAIVAIALILSPSIPGELHALLGSAYFALASAMACRVFRAVLLGIIKDPQASSAKISTVIRAANSNRHDGNDDDGTTTSKHDKPALSSNFINVAVKMDTRTEYSDGYTLWERDSTGDDLRHDASQQV